MRRRWRGGGGIKWERVKERNLWRPWRLCFYHLFTLLKASLLWWTSQGAHMHAHTPFPAQCRRCILFFFFTFTLVETESPQVFTSENLGLWNSPLSINKISPPTSQLPVLAYLAQILIWYSWFLSILGLGGIARRGVWRGAVLLCHAYRSLSPTAPGDPPSDHKLIRKKKEKKSWFAPAEIDFFFFYFSAVVFRVEDLVTFS